MFGSSNFFHPSSHPTMEEQVNKARQISKSLTEPQNQKSKGQSMYVKRKLKSIKWVHESKQIILHPSRNECGNQSTSLALSFTYLPD